MTNDGIKNRAIALARMWATSPTGNRRARGDRQLLRLLARPAELDLAVLLAEGLAHATSARARANALDRIDAGAHQGIGLVTSASLATAHTFTPYLPAGVGALARWRHRAVLGGFVVEGTDSALTRHLAATSGRGQRVDFTVLGAAPTGEAQARAYAGEVRTFLQRADVDYLSLNPAHLVSQLNPWDLPGESERIAERLRPILRIAQEGSPHKFLNLDVDSYASIALITNLFEKVFSEEEFMRLSVGLTIQAYLPGTVEALERLVEFATRRVQAGGAPLKVRLVKGGDLDGERRAAQAEGWQTPTYPSKLDTDANYLRLIDLVLRPEVAYALRVGVATHNLFHVAHAHLLAEERGVAAALDVEMHHVTGPVDVQAVQREIINPIVIHTHVLPEAGWDGETSLLSRILADAGREGSFLKDLAAGRLQAQEDVFVAAWDHQAPRRSCRSYRGELPAEGFRTTPVSDPVLATAREELITAVRDAATNDPGTTAALPTRGTVAEVDAAVAEALSAHAGWSGTPATTRTGVLRTIAEEIDGRRAELVAALCAETGKTLTEADAEVSEAVDYAVYHALTAASAGTEAARQGLDFTPDRLVAVAAPRTAPLAAVVAGTTAALAAGAAAIVRPSVHTPRSGRLAMQVVHAGLDAHGAARQAATFTLTDEAAAGRHLVSHPDVDSVVLTGSHATAALFTSWRVGRERGPRVFAATQGNNTIIVTPTADVRAATRDVLASAFINAGQSCTRADTVILVGTRAQTEGLWTGLVDGIRSMTVDWGTNPAAQIGALAAPATPMERAGLESLGTGEEWLLAPQQLDDDGRLWRPGIKLAAGPQQGASPSIPVLTVLHTPTLEQAIEWQNANDHGLLGAVYSRDAREIDDWLAAVEVGSAYVNRGFAGPTVGRIPLGGWKRSVTGPGAKVGGPGFPGLLGQWHDVGEPEGEGEIGPRVGEFLGTVGPWLDGEDRDWLERAARCDAAAREGLRRPVDRTGLDTELNVLRYRPGPRVTLRGGADAQLRDVLRVYAAALATGVDAGVSIAPEVFAQLPAAVRKQWRTAQEPAAEAGETGPAPEGVPSGVDIAASALGWVAGWLVETLAEFDTRASTWVQPGRIRCIGREEVGAISEAVSTSIALLCGPVVRSGERELLTFLREQSVSMRGTAVWDGWRSGEGRLDLTR